MMPNLKEVSQPKTLLELFRLDHEPQYLVKDHRGNWQIVRIRMDFRNQRFGVQYNSGHFQDLTRDEDIEHYFCEVYEIDDLFDKIKEGK